jgi:hypothetical protein
LRHAEHHNGAKLAPFGVVFADERPANLQTARTLGIEVAMARRPGGLTR